MKLEVEASDAHLQNLAPAKMRELLDVIRIQPVHIHLKTNKSNLCASIQRKKGATANRQLLYGVRRPWAVALSSAVTPLCC